MNFWSFLKNRELLLVIGAQVVQTLISFAQTKILATHFSLYNYGIYALVLSITSIFTQLFIGPLGQAIARYVSIYEDKKEFGALFTTIIIFNLTLLVTYFVLTPIFVSLGDDPSWPTMIFVSGLYVLIDGLKNSFIAIESANRNRGTVLIALLVEGCIRIFTIFLIIKYFTTDPTNILLAFIFSGALFILYYLINKRVLIQFLSYSQLKSVSKHILFFISPMIIWGVFEWTRTMSNRWILGTMFTKEDVALFTMISNLSIYFSCLFQSIIGNFATPIIYQIENKERNSKQSEKVIILPLLLIAFIFLFANIFSLFFSDEIIVFVLDKKYLPFSWILPVLLSSYCFMMLSQSLTFKIFAHEKTKLLILPQSLPGIISVILNIICGKFFGITGIVWATFSVNLIQAFMLIYVTSQYNKKA